MQYAQPIKLSKPDENNLTPKTSPEKGGKGWALKLIPKLIINKIH